MALAVGEASSIMQKTKIEQKQKEKKTFGRERKKLFKTKQVAMA
jgi:hypothetical protein